jgi:hypothetical protein
MNSKERRLDKIFDLLHQELTPGEINYIIEDRYKQGELTENRGKLSIINTKNAIKPLPFVVNIKENDRDSYEDAIKKYDLTVSLSRKNINTVGVQVKSSHRGVYEFYKKIDPDLDKAKMKAMEKRLIVLNGQLSEEKIRDGFSAQFSAIEEYFQSNQRLQSV